MGDTGAAMAVAGGRRALAGRAAASRGEVRETAPASGCHRRARLFDALDRLEGAELRVISGPAGSARTSTSPVTPEARRRGPLGADRLGLRGHPRRRSLRLLGGFALLRGGQLATDMQRGRGERCRQDEPDHAEATDPAAMVTIRTTSGLSPRVAPNAMGCTICWSSAVREDHDHEHDQRRPASPGRRGPAARRRSRRRTPR